MKTLFRSIICAICILINFTVLAQIKQSPIDSVKQAVIKFDSKILDLGKVKVNSKTKGKFYFKNIGSKGLFIKTVKPHCGCTIANYSKNILNKGEKGEIEIEFIAPPTPSFALKTLIVSANTLEKSYLLKIKAEVIE